MLSCCKQILSSYYNLSLFAYLIAGSYVAVGTTVSVNYLASVCEMDVVRIKAENGDVVDVDSTVSLSETMTVLSLAEGPTNECDRSFDTINTSEFISLSNNCQMRFFQIAERTKVVLFVDDKKKPVNTVESVTLDDIGGLDSQKALLLRLVKLMLNRQNEKLADCYG